MPKKKNTVRKDGLIAVQIYLGRDESGKRKYKTVYGQTQKEADNKAAEIKDAMRKGVDFSAASDSFGSFAERWLKQKHRKNVSTNWYASYKAYVKQLGHYLEHIQIAKVSVDDIQTIIDDLSEINPNTGKPASKKHLLNITSTAKQIFDFAISRKAITYNPVADVELPIAQESQKRRALTDEEQRWICETEHRAKCAAMIMMYAGLRRGELIPLTWNDINLDDRTIAINKAVQLIKGKLEVKSSAKTDAGRRVIDIPQRLADYLRGVQRNGVLVCANAKGTIHTDSSWTKMWESYLTDINFQQGDFGPFQKKPKSKFDPGGVPFVIPRFTAHWLRHTFCTMMYLAGVDILTAKNQMGHADIKTTLAIYTHLDSIHKRKSMSKLDDFLDGASSMQVSKTE